VLGPEASARPWAPRRRDGCACGTSTWSRAGVLAVLVAGNTEFSFESSRVVYEPVTHLA
jgi:hypothetical protein